MGKALALALTYSLCGHFLTGALFPRARGPGPAVLPSHLPAAALERPLPVLAHTLPWASLYMNCPIHSRTHSFMYACVLVCVTFRRVSPSPVCPED